MLLKRVLYWIVSFEQKSYWRVFLDWMNAILTTVMLENIIRLKVSQTLVVMNGRQNVITLNVTQACVILNSVIWINVIREGVFLDWMNAISTTVVLENVIWLNVCRTLVVMNGWQNVIWLNVTQACVVLNSVI
jgi:hypothetical protein